MTQPCFSVTVEDYELRTGIDVATSMEPTVQVWLNDIASLICLYLGDCADEVAAAYPDMLTALACAHVLAQSSRPAPGVRSESVGSTNVTYDTDRLAQEVTFGLTADEQNVLNQLLAVVCPDQAADTGGGVGQLGVTWGGHSDASWAADIDVWVVAR
jgi:hypothetical protein